MRILNGFNSKATKTPPFVGLAQERKAWSVHYNNILLYMYIYIKKGHYYKMWYFFGVRDGFTRPWTDGNPLRKTASFICHCALSRKRTLIILYTYRHIGYIMYECISRVNSYSHLKCLIVPKPEHENTI